MSEVSSCAALEVNFGGEDFFLASIDSTAKEIVFTSDVTKRLLFEKMATSEMFTDAISQVLLSHGYQARVKAKLVFGRGPFLNEKFCKNLPTVDYNVLFEDSQEDTSINKDVKDDQKEGKSIPVEELSQKTNQSGTFEGENLSKNSYYNKGPVECFDALISSRGVHNFVEFCIQNAQTYLWRAGDKPDQPLLKDLIKTGVFINKAVEVLQKFEEGKIDEYGNSKEG